MEIVQIIGVGIIATILILIVKEQKPMFAFLIATMTSITIFMMLISKIGAVIQVLTRLASCSGMDAIHLKTVLKIIGIAYVTEFGSQIVRDAGQEGIASKIEFAGKVLIITFAVPIITVIIETVMKLMSM